MEGQSADLISSLLPLVALFAIFYFLIIRPQQKQAKQHKTMITELKKGDKIVTNGGLMVEITKVEENIEDKGPEAAIIVVAPSCAAPAKTNNDINWACKLDKPILIANDPHKKPQGTVANAKGMMSNIACRTVLKLVFTIEFCDCLYKMLS